MLEDIFLYIIPLILANNVVICSTPVLLCCPRRTILELEWRPTAIGAIYDFAGIKTNVVKFALKILRILKVGSQRNELFYSFIINLF